MTRTIQFEPNERLFAGKLNDALDEVANQAIDVTGISVRGFMRPEDGSDIGPALRRIRDEGYLATDRRNTISIPAGNWIVSSIDPIGPGYAMRLDGVSNFSIRGAGSDQTIIKAANGTDIGLFNLTNVSNAEISDFTFDGNRENQVIAIPTRPNKHGIRGLSLVNVRFLRLNILNAQAYGLGLQSGNFQDITIEDVLIDGPGLDGIDFKNATGTNRNININRLRVFDVGRSDPSTGKAGLDVRGPVRVSNTYIALRSGIGAALGTPFFRVRADSSGSISYTGMNILPEEQDVVTGLTSGATAMVVAVSGSATLANGGIGLTDIVGAFVNGENIELTGGKTGRCSTYSPPNNFGGGNTVFVGCTAAGPTDTVCGVGFAVSDSDVEIVAPRITDVRLGISCSAVAPPADGGVRVNVVSPYISGVEDGIRVQAGGIHVVGGAIANATDVGIDIIDGPDAVVHGTHFVDCARAIRRNVASIPTRLLDLRFTNTPIDFLGFDYGDQRSTFPHVPQRPGTVFSILPSANYSSTAALVGGAGGAENSLIYFFPLPIFSRVSLLRFGTVIGANVAGVSGKIALYSDLGETPGNDGVTTINNLLAEAPGVVDLGQVANAQVRVTLPAPLTVSPGLYWLALKANGAARPYTVPIDGPVGEWARFVGMATASSLFSGTGGTIRIATTNQVDYNAPFPAACPVVTFGTTGTGSPFLFATAN